MNRAQLEHIIRASAAIAGDDEIVVIGSQAILGQFPTPPEELVERDELLRRLPSMPVDDARRALAEQRIRADHPR